MLARTPWIESTQGQETHEASICNSKQTCGDDEPEAMITGPDQNCFKPDQINLSTFGSSPGVDRDCSGLIQPGRDPNGFKTGNVSKTGPALIFCRVSFGSEWIHFGPVPEWSKVNRKANLVQFTNQIHLESA